MVGNKPLGKVIPIIAPLDADALALDARGGDPVASDRLWDFARMRLVKIALGLGVPPDDVSDLVQEALLSGWRNLEKYDPRKGSFIAWLIPALRGRALNRSRAGERRYRFLEKLKTFTPRMRDERETTGSVDARLVLGKLLGGLTERQREVVALYELEGLSAGETAEILGIQENSVRSIARDARHGLRREAGRLHRRLSGNS